MKKWLRETHGPNFELLRHFVRRFFDSDLSTTPDHMTGVLIGAIPVFFQWFFLLVLPFRAKYAQLSSLSGPGAYRAAVRADELWLITLMMSAIGLLTAIKWQSLFPDLRDYRALGTLPLRARQIFGAKLAALLSIASATLIILNSLPSIGFPVISSSRWAFNPSLGARIWAHAGASLAACSFFFFGLLALQGVLLNLLPPRAFGRVTGNLQGFLVGIMLVLIIGSFSIQPRITSIAVQPEWARWLPPVWFLGLYQTLSGDPAPLMRALSQRATIALTIAVALTFSTYFLSYRRHRTLLVEGASKSSAGKWRWAQALIGWLASDPRQQAVLSFTVKTLARSSYHRMIVIAYSGLALAFVVTGVGGMGSSVERVRALTAGFVYFHLIALLLLLAAIRHVFSLPTELKANWIFQITEGESRGMWFRAVDKAALFCGSVPMLIIPLPVEVWLLGWRGMAEAALFTALGLLSYEWVFSSWQKLPFTCSRRPGKTPIWMVVGFFGLIALVSLLHSFILVVLDNPRLFIVILGVLLAAWVQVHRTRRLGWTELHFIFDDTPEPVVRGLNLLR